VSLCDVTLGPVSGSRNRPLWGGQRTVQRDGDAFGQHIAIRADKNGHLAQRVDLEKLLMVFLIVFVCVDDIQFEALRFRDG
jgi:hypothetical protein